MLINKSNYEVFAIDYIEGNLEGADLKAMKAFLKSNPEIAAEMESLESNFVELTPNEDIVYNHKAVLLKEIEAVRIPFYRRYMAAAAAIALLLVGFGAGYFIANQHTDSQQVVVKYIPIETEQISTPNGSIASNKEESQLEKEELQIQKTTNEIAISKKQEKAVPSSRLRSKQPVNNMEEVIASTVSTKEEAIEPMRATPISEAFDATEKESVMVAIAPLPTIAKPPLTTIPNKQEDTINVSLNAERLAMNEDNESLLSRVGRVRRFVGRLPFEEATLKAFVPSYFVNDSAD